MYGNHFTVHSDHKPLVYLFSLKEPSSRLTRIRLDLEEYQFEIKHIKGKDNCVAGALSRITIDDLKTIAPTDAKVYAITRSMTNKNREIPKNTINEAIETKPIVYEDQNQIIYEGIPSVSSTINTIRPEISLKVSYRTDNKLHHIMNRSNVKDDRFAESFLSLLEQSAGIANFPFVKLFTNDEIFTKISVSNFKVLGASILKNTKIVIIPSPTEITEAEKQRAIIEKFHNDPVFGGHVGSKLLYAKLSCQYKWKNMAKQISIYTRQCHKCQTNKAKQKQIEPMIITNSSQRCFDRIIIDTVGPLPKSENGNNYTLTIMCDLSKYLISAALPSKDAKKIAKAIFEHVILIYGPIKEIIADCGSEFKNQILKELCALLNIQQIHSTPYHHETVGVVERNHRVLNEYFRSYLNTHQQWEEYIKYYTFCFNTTPHTSFDNRFSPFELVFGKKPEIFGFLQGNQIDPLYSIDNFAKEVKFKLQHANKIALNLMNKNKEKSKENYDKNIRNSDYKIDDKILLIDHARHKLDPIYKGPFIITDIKLPNIEIMDANSSKKKWVHINNTVKYIS